MKTKNKRVRRRSFPLRELRPSPWTFRKLLVIVIACVSLGGTCKVPGVNTNAQGGAVSAYCQSYGAYNPWEASMSLGGGVVAGLMGLTAPILTYNIPGLGGGSYPWVFWYSSAAAVAQQAAAADAGSPGTTTFGGLFGPGVMSSLTAEIVVQGPDYVLSIGDRQYGALVEYSNPDATNPVFIPSNYDGSRLWIDGDGNPVIFRGHTAQKFTSNNGGWIYAGNCYGTLELAMSSTSNWKLCDPAWGPPGLTLTWNTAAQPAILTSIQTPVATITPKWTSAGTANEGQGSFQGFLDPNQNLWSFNYDASNRFWSFAKPADATGFQDTVFFSYYSNSNVVATISSKAAGNPIFLNLDPKTGLFLGDTIGNGTPSGTPGSIKFSDGTIELVTYGTVPNVVNGPAFRTIVVSNVYGSAQVTAGPCVETASVDQQGETTYYNWNLTDSTPTTGPTYLGQSSPTNSDDTVIIESYSMYGNAQLSTDVTSGTLTATNYATEAADMYGDPSDVVAMPATSLPSNLVFGTDWSTQAPIASAMYTHYTYWNNPAANWATGELATASMTAPAIASAGPPNYTQTLSYTYSVDAMSNWNIASTDTAQPKALPRLVSVPPGGNFGVRTMTSEIGLTDTVDVEGSMSGQVITERSGEGGSVVTTVDANSNPYSVVFNNDMGCSLKRTFDNAGNMTQETSTATGIESSAPIQTTYNYVNGVLFGQSDTGPDMSVQSTTQLSYDPTTGNFVGEATNGVLDDVTTQPGTNPNPDLPANYLADYLSP